MIFIRSGQLRVVLTNTINVRFQTPKSKNPIPPKKWKIWAFWSPILGPIFLEIDYFLGTGGIGIGQTQPWLELREHRSVKSLSLGRRFVNLLPVALSTGALAAPLLLVILLYFYVRTYLQVLLCVALYIHRWKQYQGPNAPAWALDDRSS